jgi:hypothetical protein
MTTIVYDHKARQIAVDSRLCAGDKIQRDDSQKWFIHDGAYWFASGCTIAHDFAKSLFSELKNQWKKYGDNDPSFGYFIAKDGDVWFLYYCSDGNYNMEKCTHTDGCGSGGEYALAALDFGKTAKEAVEYAKTKDTRTGGEVHVFDVETMRFI